MLIEHENLETLKTSLAGEALLFGLLGKTLYADPDRNWLDTLIQEDVFVEAPFGQEQPETQKGLDLLKKWAGRYSTGISEPEIEKIKKDHLYLFIGVGKALAPIWESVYFSDGRLVFQKETLEVRGWYARFGLEAERKGREPDDHIGLEISFVAHLATMALQTLEDDNLPLSEEYLKAQHDFLTQHLLRWAFSWEDLVQQHAETDFYRGLSSLAAGALKSAAALLHIKFPEEESN